MPNAKNWPEHQYKRYCQKYKYLFHKIAKLGILSKLVTRAAKDIELTEMSRPVLAPADPTPTVFALSTCHVVTTVDFFGTKTTIRAFDNIVFSHVLTQFGIADVAAAHSWMVNCTTLKAHLLSAGTSCHAPIDTTDFLSPNILIAANTRAPLQIFICLYHDILLKLFVFVIESLRS